MRLGVRGRRFEGSCLSPVDAHDSDPVIHLERLSFLTAMGEFEGLYWLLNTVAANENRSRIRVWGQQRNWGLVDELVRDSRW